MASFAVVGAGIAGLSAAWELEQAGHDVVVFEAADRPGGKLQQSPVPGVDFPVDEGADAFLARVPDALDLCAELGIDDLVHPATGDAWVHAGDGLRRLPKAQLLGVPTDVDEVAASGLVSPAGIERAREDLAVTHARPPEGDVSVGALVRGRLGDEVCDHLVEPLLGGINAGEADGLSARSAAPQIWACAQEGGSLIRAAADLKARAASDAPVFATPTAGMAELPRRLVEQLSAEIRVGTPVPPIRLDGDATVRDEHFAGVVVAAPADAAAKVLADAAPDAARHLTGIEFASVAMVTVVAEADRVDHPLDGSGLVVARTAGASITAASWGSSKWSHWHDGQHVVFRISLGHDRDPVDWCALDDEELVATALADLRRILDTDVTPTGTRVGRWLRSFPQYRPGHAERVDDLRAAAHAAGPVALAGMSLDGIGVPACIRGGRAAARRLLGRG